LYQNTPSTIVGTTPPHQTNMIDANTKPFRIIPNIHERNASTIDRMTNKSTLDRMSLSLHIAPTFHQMNDSPIHRTSLPLRFVLCFQGRNGSTCSRTSLSLYITPISHWTNKSALD
jgi:hypothetical protein